MNCKACNGEATIVINTNEIDKKHRQIVNTNEKDPNNVEIVVGCDYCFAEKSFRDGSISEASAKKFCKCFNSGHNKSVLP